MGKKSSFRPDGARRAGGSSLPVQSGLVSNLEGSCDETPQDIARQAEIFAPGLASVLRPLARLGLTRQKRAVAPRAGRRIAWKLYATRHNSPEAWTNAHLLAPPATAAPTSQRVRFGSRRAARAADEPAAAATIDEPAAAATIFAHATPPLRHAPVSGKPTQRLSATRKTKTKTIGRWPPKSKSASTR